MDGVDTTLVGSALEGCGGVPKGPAFLDSVRNRIRRSNGAEQSRPIAVDPTSVRGKATRPGKDKNPGEVVRRNRGDKLVEILSKLKIS